MERVTLANLRAEELERMESRYDGSFSGLLSLGIRHIHVVVCGLTHHLHDRGHALPIGSKLRVFDFDGVAELPVQQPGIRSQACGFTFEGVCAEYAYIDVRPILCYAVKIPGRRSILRAGFLTDC
jgi:hypothetical protein